MAQDEIGQGKDVEKSMLGTKLKEPFRHFPMFLSVTVSRRSVDAFEPKRLLNAKPQLAQCLCSSFYPAEIQNI